MENLYLQGGRGSARHGKVLDPRGVFLVQSSERVWLWIGIKVMSGNIQSYKNAALNHLKLLQTHERAPVTIEIVEQGNESKEFWNEFGLQEAPSRFAYDNI